MRGKQSNVQNTWFKDQRESSAVGMKRVHLGDEMSKATKRDLLELKKCIV
jgi:hypothetical protein